MRRLIIDSTINVLTEQFTKELNVYLLPLSPLSFNLDLKIELIYLDRTSAVNFLFSVAFSLSLSSIFNKFEKLVFVLKLIEISKESNQRFFPSFRVNCSRRLNYFLLKQPLCRWIDIHLGIKITGIHIIIDF